MMGALRTGTEMSQAPREGQGDTKRPVSEQVRLRNAKESDLPQPFEFQVDPEAKWMAAFGADPASCEAFVDRWKKVLRDPKCQVWTVLLGGRIVGSIDLFELFGKPSVGYWYSREIWGRGVATRALMEFLRIVPIRPLFARVAKDNLASIRVLKKCGFTEAGEDKGFAPARNAEIEEWIFRRDEP
jgi:RimJ/RimL family protein N-acetyltransferase